MPFDIAFSYYTADKSHSLDGDLVNCPHSDNYASPQIKESDNDESKSESKPKIQDYSKIPLSEVENAYSRTKHSYDIACAFGKFCPGCSLSFYGRNITYDMPRKTIGFFFGGRDGMDNCGCCNSRFRHDPHIRIIASKEKRRGLRSKRRILPQRIYKNISTSSIRKEASGHQRFCSRREKMRSIAFDIREQIDDF